MKKFRPYIYYFWHLALPLVSKKPCLLSLSSRCTCFLAENLPFLTFEVSWAGSSRWEKASWVIREVIVVSIIVSVHLIAGYHSWNIHYQFKFNIFFENLAFFIPFFFFPRSENLYGLELHLQVAAKMYSLLTFLQYYRNICSPLDAWNGFMQVSTKV